MPRERRLALTTWGLALAAAGLGIYVYIAEVRGGERLEHSREVAARLLPFPTASATELAIERAGRQIVCRKVQDRWRIVAPIQADADESSVTRLLEDIEKARIERVVTGHAVDLTAYGLAKPVVVTISAGGQRQCFSIGKTNPTGEFVFVERQQRGSPIVLAEQNLKRVADISLYELREKSVLTFRPDDVTGIVFACRGRRLRLARAPAAPGESETGWQITEPIRARADRGVVDRALDLVSGLRAEAFVSETQVSRKKYGLEVPWGRARLELKNGPAETLLIGGKTVEAALTRWYACRPAVGPIFTVNDNLPGDLLKAATDWRERHMVDFQKSNIAELRLITPRRTVVCAKTEDQKSGDQWRLAEYSGPVAESMSLGAAARMPSAVPADHDRIDDLIRRLETLQARAFLDKARADAPKYGLAPPALKVAALDKSGKLLASISFGALHGPDRYATGPHLASLVLIPASEVAPFAVSTENLAARK